MTETKSNDINTLSVFLIDPQSKKQIGEISLSGDPVPATEWIDSNGPLQGFVILDGMDNLRNAWVYQEEILLCTDLGQQLIKIVTFPSDGEDSGFLDYTGDFEKYQTVTQKSKFRISSATS